MSYISCGIQPPYGRHDIYHTMCLILWTTVHSVNMIMAHFHWSKEWHSDRNCFKLLPRWNSWKEVNKVLLEVSPGGMFLPRRPQYQNLEWLLSAKILHMISQRWIIYFLAKGFIVKLMFPGTYISSVAFLFSYLCHWKSLLIVNEFEGFFYSM